MSPLLFYMLAKQNNLIQGLKKQDKQVIAELYDLYADTLYGIILKVVNQHEGLAQDILQDAFVKIWKNGDRYDESKGTLFTWMLNICRNQAIDKTRSANFKRKSSIQDYTQETSNNIQHSYEQRPEHIGLKSEVGRLEEKYREVIELIYFQGFTQVEVVEHLDIPLGTVKSRIRIGLRELKKRFGTIKTGKAILFFLAFEQLKNLF